jgi:hypothetical protein
MSAFELFVAIGGTLLVIFFIIQALQREREPDGYKHRDGLIAMARRGKVKPSVPLRPAAARMLAAKEKAAAAKPKQRGTPPAVSEDDSKPSVS